MALVLGGILAAIAVTELALVLFNVSPERRTGPIYLDLQNPITGWAHRPNAAFVANGEEEFQVPVQINSHGLRDREYSYAKPPGTHRMLILGDSFAAALEVPLEQSWHEILETTLRQPERRQVEFLSAGVGGWGTDQELLYFSHEGYRYEPDMVMLEFFQNDVQDNDTDLVDRRLKNEKPFFVLHGSQLELRNFPYRGRQSNSILARSRIYRMAAAWRRIARESAQREDREGGCGESTRVPKRFLTYAHEQPAEYGRAWSLTRLLIQNLNADVTRHGGKLIVVYFPDRRQVLPGAWSATIECFPSARQMTWDLDKPNLTLAEILRGDGIPFLDLTPAFRRAARTAGAPLYFSNNHHFQRAGHRLAAETIVDWLLNQGFVPPP